MKNLLFFLFIPISTIINAQSSAPAWVNVETAVDINDFNTVGAVPNLADSYSYTKQIIKPNEDGSISYVVGPTNKVTSTRYFGLSPNTAYYRGQPLKYGFSVYKTNGNVRSYIDGVTGAIIAYSLGDVVTIKKIGNQIQFLKNNVIIQQTTCDPTLEYFGDVWMPSLNYFEDLRINFNNLNPEYEIAEGTNYILTSDGHGGSVISKLNQNEPTKILSDQIFQKELCSSILINLDSTKFSNNSFLFEFDSISEVDISSDPIFSLEFNQWEDSLSLFTFGVQRFKVAISHQKIVQLEYCKSRLISYINDQIIDNRELLPAPPYKCTISMPDNGNCFFNPNAIWFENTENHALDYSISEIDSTGASTLSIVALDFDEQMTFFIGDSLMNIDSLNLVLTTPLPFSQMEYENNVCFKDQVTIELPNYPISIPITTLKNNISKTTVAHSRYQLVPDDVFNHTWDKSNSIITRLAASGYAEFSTYNTVLTGAERADFFVKPIFYNRTDIGAMVGFSVPDTTVNIAGKHIKYGLEIKDVALRVHHAGTIYQTQLIYNGGELGITIDNDSVYYFNNGIEVYKGPVQTNKLLVAEAYTLNANTKLKVTRLTNSALNRPVSKKQYLKVKHNPCDQYNLGEISISFPNTQCPNPTYTLYRTSDLINSLSSNTTGTFVNLEPGSYTVKVVSSCATYYLYTDVGYEIDWNMINSSSSPYVSSDATSIKHIGTNSFATPISTRSNNNSNGANAGWISFKTNLPMQDLLVSFVNLIANETSQASGILFLSNYRIAYTHDNDGNLNLSSATVSSASAWKNYKVSWDENNIRIFENGILILEETNAGSVNLNNCFTHFLTYGNLAFIKECFASFDCKSVLQLVRVGRSLNAEDYLLLGENLKIAYTEDYQPTDENVQYRIYSSEKYPYSPELTGSLSTTKGLNHFNINCSSLHQNSYILVIENAKSEKFFLRFWKS